MQIFNDYNKTGTKNSFYDKAVIFLVSEELVDLYNAFSVNLLKEISPYQSGFKIWFPIWRLLYQRNLINNL